MDCMCFQPEAFLSGTDWPPNKSINYNVVVTNKNKQSVNENGLLVRLNIASKGSINLQMKVLVNAIQTSRKVQK